MTDIRQDTPGEATLFDAMGGEPTFRRLVHVPGEGPRPGRGALRPFLMQYWGGPRTYSERRGQPRLRMRHAPFRVDRAAHDAWLHHMRVAVDDLGLPADLEHQLWDYVTRAAASMTMLEEARAAQHEPALAGTRPPRVGTAAGLRPLPAWKQTSDFVFVQVSFSLDALLKWREANRVDTPVYAGVMVLASENHAQHLAAAIPDIDIPTALVEKVATDRLAGVEAACEHILRIRESGAFDGVHLIPVGRYREAAASLENLL